MSAQHIKAVAVADWPEEAAEGVLRSVRQAEAAGENPPQLYEEAAKHWPAFKWPPGRFIRLFTRPLPPAPQPHLELWANWRTIWRYVTVGVVLQVLALFAGVMAAGYLVVTQGPWLRITPITLVSGLIFGGDNGYEWQDFYYRQNEGWTSVLPTASTSPLWLHIVLTILVLLVAWLFLKSIPRMALLEEQMFRQGAENWTWRQRIKASALFGFCHVGNLVYPLSSLLIISVGGLGFVWIYLRQYRRDHNNLTATYRVTAVHALFNAVVICTLTPVILLLIWFV